jgi:hypothetical protein
MLAPTFFGGNIVPTGMPVKTAPLPSGPDMKEAVNAAPFCSWDFVAGNTDFTTEQVLQVSFDLMRNDPADKNTYLPDTDEQRLANFMTDYLDTGNSFATEEETTFYYNFINDKKTNTFLNIIPPSFTQLLKPKIYDPITKGEDPRSYLESVRPVIDQMLKDMAS